MTIAEIRQLVELVQESSIVELEITLGEDTIRIVREHPSVAAQIPPQVYAAPAVAPQSFPVFVQPATATTPVSTSASSAPEAEGRRADTTDLREVKAPMVGTFYRAPSPDSPPYVEVGTQIAEGQVICIIEAMKLMNEIPSDEAGTIVEILVDNAQPVEYGQVLMRIRPD